MLNQSLWLSDAEVASLLTPRMAIEAVTGSLLCHARGDYQQPLKPYLRPQGRENEYRGGRFIAMPAYLGTPFQVAGIKWIAGFPANIERGLPRASGVLVLNSVETGVPLALMACATLSIHRTAAVAAITVDLLGPAAPQTIALFGAGPVGTTVAEFLACEKRAIGELRIFDIRRQRAERLAERLSQESPLQVRVCDSPEMCAASADVVVTATTGAKGYLRHEWLGERWLLISLSLDDCTPDVLLGADKVIVDDFDQCNREEKLLHRLCQAGRFSRQNIYAELGEIVAGLKAGRESEGEKIYVNLMGMAIEDVAVGMHVYRAAIRNKVGTVLQ